MLRWILWCIGAVAVLSLGGVLSHRFYGPEGLREYAWAIGVNLLAGTGGLICIGLIRSCWGLISGVVLGGLVRMLLVSTGVIFYLWISGQGMMWFLLWVVVLYFLVLILETSLVIRVAWRVPIEVREFEEGEMPV